MRRIIPMAVWSSIIVLVSGCMAAPRSIITPAPTTMVERDLVYDSPEGHRLQFDRYLPSGTTGLLPTVIYVHGGGWFSGSRAPCPLVSLTDHGYQVISIAYRLTTEHRARWPEPVQDVQRAVRHFFAHAQELAIDPQRVVIAGGSAGGHLALMAALDNDRPVRPAGVIAFFPPTDLARLHEQGEEYWLNLNFTMELLLGGEPGDPGVDVAAASPIAQVDPEDPPVLLVHGDADILVPVEQSELMAQALGAAGVDYRFLRIPGGRHGSRLLGREEVQAGVRTWLDALTDVGRPPQVRPLVEAR